MKIIRTNMIRLHIGCIRNCRLIFKKYQFNKKKNEFFMFDYVMKKYKNK